MKLLNITCSWRSRAKYFAIFGLFLMPFSTLTGKEVGVLKKILNANHCILVLYENGRVKKSSVIRSNNIKEAHKFEKRVTQIEVEGANSSKLICYYDIIHNGKKIGTSADCYDVDSELNITIPEAPYKCSLSKIIKAED